MRSDPCRAWFRGNFSTWLQTQPRVDRYDALYGKVRGVIYFAENDLEGTRKAHRCRDAAASVEVDFIHVDMAVVFEDLPLKGSIDDVPDVPAAVQQILDSLPSQLPAQVDYDDELTKSGLRRHTNESDQMNL